MTLRLPTIRYRCPTCDGAPPLGCIIMGAGPRVRRGYRVISATRVRGALQPGFGVAPLYDRESRRAAWRVGWRIEDIAQRQSLSPAMSSDATHHGG